MTDGTLEVAMDTITDGVGRDQQLWALNALADADVLRGAASRYLTCVRRLRFGRGPWSTSRYSRGQVSGSVSTGECSRTLYWAAAYSASAHMFATESRSTTCEDRYGERTR